MPASKQTAAMVDRLAAQYEKLRGKVKLINAREKKRIAHEKMRKQASQKKKARLKDLTNRAHMFEQENRAKAKADARAESLIKKAAAQATQRTKNLANSLDGGLKPWHAAVKDARWILVQRGENPRGKINALARELMAERRQAFAQEQQQKELEQ